MQTTFITDIHLGKLAKSLRLLGFNTWYSNNATAVQLTTLAAAQNRVLLSRYTGYKPHPHLQILLIDSADPMEQLWQVEQHFNLKDKIEPFSRCLLCNGVLATVPKEWIQAQLQPNTQQAFHAFWQCHTCQHIYWKGSHYERMLALVEKVKAFSR